MIGHIGGLPWTNTVWFAFEGSPSGSDLDTLADGGYTAWEDNLLDFTSTANVLTQCVATVWDGGLELEGVHVASEAGTNDQEPVPGNVALVVSWKIREHYRGGKPRSYIAGCTRDKYASNAAWDDDFVAAVSTLAQSYLDDVNALTAGGITAVVASVVHFFSDGAALDPPQLSPLVGAAAQKRICTQRRRLGAEL